MGMIAQSMPLSKDLGEYFRVLSRFLTDNKEGSWNTILPEKGKEITGGSGVRTVIKGQGDCVSGRGAPADDGQKEAQTGDKRGYAAGNQEYTQGNSCQKRIDGQEYSADEQSAEAEVFGWGESGFGHETVPGWGTSRAFHKSLCIDISMTC